MDISWSFSASGVYIVVGDERSHTKLLLTCAVRSRSWESAKGREVGVPGHNYVGTSRPCLLHIC